VLFSQPDRGTSGAQAGEMLDDLGIRYGGRISRQRAMIASAVA